MASVAKEKNGYRRILFVAPDGRRKTIRLGKVSHRAAEGIKYRVEQLLECLLLNRPMEADLAQWAAGLEPRLAKRLAAVGLIPKPEAKAATALGPFLADFTARRIDVKPATKIVWGQTVRDLLEYFGADRDMVGVTEADAEDFKMFLLGRELAPTTIHKRLQFARMFFRAAKKRRLIHENPFESVKAAATGVQERQRFITREDIARVFECCPNHHWRTIVALSRFGGLRCPSEVLSLRWHDIDWAAGRILVTSPKTEHHPDKATRTIPLFAELRPYLEEAFELAPEGAEYVVDDKYRKAAMGPSGWINANLRTTFEKIIRRAGLTPWPRLFHNLRASRETELAKEYPIHVVTSWLGNTPHVALKHYLQVTDADFERAAKVPTGSGAESGAQVAQNPAQHPRAGSRKESQKASATTDRNATFANPCNSMREYEHTFSGGHGIRTHNR